jgi:hypothetical protein
MARGMMPTDLFRIQWVSDARLSPAGRLVAFTRSVNRVIAKASSQTKIMIPAYDQC